MADELQQALVTEENEDVPTWRRWLPWVALALIILLVAWLLWMYGDWRRADVDRRAAVVVTNMVKVPDVVGMTAKRARAVLKRAGFDVETEVSFDTIAKPGTVANQAPLAGRRAEKGSTVFIGVVADLPAAVEDDVSEPDYQGEEQGMTSRPAAAVDKGPVPDLIGLSEAAAVDRIEAAGFVARPMYQPRAIEKPYVYQQAPEAGEELEIGEQVHFLILIPRVD